MKPISNGCKYILRKMLNQRRIGGKHIPETLCLRWIKHLSKNDHKETLKDWDMCIKNGLVLVKQKPNEKHVSLNPERLDEIYSLIS